MDTEANKSVPEPDRPPDRGWPARGFMPNPFIVGNPVRDRSMFFGREAEFELVRRRFHPPARGGLLVFCGERRSGKTSILFQILDGRLGPEYLPVLIDMQSMAVENEEGFLRTIAAEVLRSLGADGEGLPRPDFSGGRRPSGVFLEFMGELCRAFPGRTPLLLFDEYELLGNKIDAGTLTEDVLHVLASLMETHAVCLVFTGSQHIEQRKQPYWRILGKSLYRVISYLQREDAVTLIRRPVEDRVTYEEGAVDLIIRLTSGQPFYTQAVCQNLIDQLNESGAARIGAADVLQVIDGIIENPFPQMIFLWDGLERGEKIALSLLAEKLGGSDDFASAAELLRTLHSGGYAWKSSLGRVAGALENLFQKDFLLKNSEREPGYAFRMDLWRLWIRRMHSVWQVLREQGLARSHHGPRSRWRHVPSIAGTLALLLLVALTVSHRRSAAPLLGGDPGVGARPGRIDLAAQPAGAAIDLDGNQVGLGSFRSPVSPGRHRLAVKAAGYADTLLLVTVAEGESVAPRIRLRALRGDLEVKTDPPGAEVWVDGEAAGRSPLMVRGLDVPHLHKVAAAIAGRDRAEMDCAVEAGGARTVLLSLAEPKAEIFVNTSPPGADILVDGIPRGASPIRVSGVSLGAVRLSARLDGYADLDTTLALQTKQQELQLALRPLPPGVLMIKGDSPATIYIDGVMIKENVQNSGEKSVRPGTHRLQITVVTGQILEDSVRVGPGEVVVYDYSQRRVVRRTAAGGVTP